MDRILYNHKYRPIFGSMRFPAKLWIIVNSKSINSIKWGQSDEKSIIIIDHDGFGKYLNSTISIFAATSVTSFLEELDRYDFKKLPDDYDGQNEMKYFHQYFIEDKYDLISNVIRKPVEPINFHNTSSKNTKYLQKLQQILFSSLCHCKEESALLTDILTKYAENAECIEISSDRFLTPSESISSFEEKPQYAGYYGQNASPEKVKEFFDEFLPKYAEAQGQDLHQRQGSRNWQVLYENATQQHNNRQELISSSKRIQNVAIDATISSSSSSSHQPITFPTLPDNSGFFANILKGNGAELSTLPDSNAGNVNYAQEENIFMDVVNMSNITSETTNRDKDMSINNTIPLKTKQEQEPSIDNDDSLDSFFTQSLSLLYES